MKKMIYADASPLKRFLAYLIDCLIIIFVLFLFTFVVDKIVFNGVQMPSELQNALLDPNKTLQDVIHICQTNLACNEYFNKFMLGLIILLIIGFVIEFLYMVILPYFLPNFQTVGRYLTHLRVVDNEYYLPTFKHIILRDFVGYFIMNLLNLFVVGLILNLFYILSRNKTIGDSIGKTRLINLNIYREIDLGNDESVEEASEIVE